MLTIKHFILDSDADQLTIELTSDDNAFSEQWRFSFEFLRVVSLNTETDKAKQPPASHKKQVQLTSIESVAKHGFRFCFDDGFQVIYSPQQLALLHQQADTLWQQYLDALNENGLSREATIEIKQL